MVIKIKCNHDRVSRPIFNDMGTDYTCLDCGKILKGAPKWLGWNGSKNN